MPRAGFVCVEVSAELALGDEACGLHEDGVEGPELEGGILA